MPSLTSKRELDAGSRMHLLDWLETPRFLTDLRGFVAPVGVTIRDDALRLPIGRKAYRESGLVGPGEPFLSADQQNELCTWWLVHRRGAKLPTWDLVVSASNKTRPACPGSRRSQSPRLGIEHLRQAENLA
jgi:hypothetical protein